MVFEFSALSAVHILDCYMDSYILSDFVEHQKLIGIVCLLLAAKSEDIDENIPSIKDLLKIVDMTNDLGVDMRFKEELDPKELSKIYRIFSALYCKLEFLIFESLDFNTIRPTAVTFINIFQSIVVTADDVKSFGVANLKSLGDLRVLANDYLKQFLEIIIQDIEFFNKLPSQLAASIIGATRKLLHISHFWNDSLAQLTRCRIEDIRLLIVTLIEKRNNAIREKSNCDLNDVFKDSGFISPTSSEAEDECKKVVKKRKLNRKVVTYEV